MERAPKAGAASSVPSWLAVRAVSGSLWRPKAGAACMGGHVSEEGWETHRRARRSEGRGATRYRFGALSLAEAKVARRRSTRRFVLVDMYKVRRDRDRRQQSLCI